MHALSNQKSQRFQRDPLSICRRPWCFLRHPTSHQLSSRSQNAATTTVRATWSAGLDVQFAWHCLRHRHNGSLPLPTRLARHWQQHEYVILHFYCSLHPFIPHCDNSPLVRHLNTCSHLPHFTLPFINHPVSPPAVSPVAYPQPPHTLTTSNPRLLHRRFLHRHRHKRSAMVRRRPQELQRPRCRTSRRRRRSRLRRRQCRRQA